MSVASPSQNDVARAVFAARELHRFNWGAVFSDHSHGLQVNSYIKSTGNAPAIPSNMRALLGLMPDEIPAGTYLLSFQVPGKYAEGGEKNAGDDFKTLASMYLRAHGIDIMPSASKPGPFYVEIRVKTPQEFLRGTRLLMDCFNGDYGFTPSQLAMAAAAGRPADMPSLPSFHSTPPFEVVMGPGADVTHVKKITLPSDIVDGAWKDDVRYQTLRKVMGPNIDRMDDKQQLAFYNGLLKSAVDSIPLVSREYDVVLPVLLRDTDRAGRAHFVEIFMEARRGPAEGQFVMPQEATNRLRVAFKEYFNSERSRLMQASVGGRDDHGEHSAAVVTERTGDVAERY